MQHTSQNKALKTETQFSGWTVADIKAIGGDMSLIKKQSLKRSRRAHKQMIAEELMRIEQEKQEELAHYRAVYEGIIW